MQYDEWKRDLFDMARKLGESVRVPDDETARQQDLSREFTVARVVADSTIDGWWLYSRRAYPGSEVAVSRGRFNSTVPQDLEPRPGDKVRYWGREMMPHGVALNDTVLWFDSTPWREEILSYAWAHSRRIALESNRPASNESQGG